MPPLTDPNRIRALLETERPWAAYALGDLAPGYREHAEWRGPAEGGEAVVLLYRGFETPVLFTLGAPEALAPLLEEVEEPRMHLSVRPEVLPLIEDGYGVYQRQRMLRMVHTPLAAVPSGGAVRLAGADAEVLRALYADGEPADEAPDFFFPAMLEAGVFYGVHEGSRLVAAAGTHLVAPSEGVAAVGNVYTRRDYRGRGLAAVATGAVVQELRGRGIGTIVLNVAVENRFARRVYERLGFRPYCEFYEGVAVRR